MPALTNHEDVTELMKKVRQARQYGPEGVSDEQLHELLEIARWTGSGRNTQPWHFIVINDKEQLKKISQLRTPINWVADAPLAIAIVTDGKSQVELYEEGRVTERLLIGAYAMGLGGGIAWFGDDNQVAEARRILGIPPERGARSVVVIGHVTSVKDPRPNPAQGGRHPLSQLVSYNSMSEQG